MTDDTKKVRKMLETATGVLLPRVKYERPPEGANMARELLEAFKHYRNNTLLVDVGAKREWSGAKLLDRAGRCATNLIRRLGVRPNHVALMMCDHSDAEILFALGHIFAGGAIYGSNPQDGYGEEKTLCELVKPDLIATNSRLHHFAVELKRQVPGLEEAHIVWVDNPLKAAQIFLDTQQIVAGQQMGVSNGPAHLPTINSATSASKSWPDFHSSIDSSSANSELQNGNGLGDENNNNDCSLDYYLEMMERDRVILLEDLMEGPLDEKLVEDVIYNRIRPEEHILTYMLTSGSTGKPKIVASTHEELMHGLYSMISANRNPIGSAALNGESIGGTKDGNSSSSSSSSSSNGGSSFDSIDIYSDDDLLYKSNLLFPVGSERIVFAGDLPLDHGAGVNTMFLSLRNGSKFIVIPSYDEDSFWQSVSDHRITSSIASTTFTYKLLTRLKELAATGEARKRWNLDSFKYITCCGSKMAFIDLIREINKQYPHLNITQSYGATEIGFIAMLSVGDCKTHLHSVGHLLPGLKAKVVDRDSGKLLGPNEPGELHVWSASKFKVYKCYKSDGDPAHLVARCHDQQGFYKTGDQAHFDEEGRIYIHGRLKDTLFLMQDWKILPAELEVVVDEHPLVEQSVVVGVPDPDLLGCDAPRAFVKLISPKSEKFAKLSSDLLREKLQSNEKEFIAGDIRRFVADRTAEPKHLKGGVIIVDDFPYVGILNKVDRKALRAQCDQNE